MLATSPLRPDDRERLGDYRLLGRITETAHGVLYAAESDAGGRVIVTLYDVTLEDPGSFLLSVGALRRLPASHLVPVLDAGTARGRPYVVTEHVDGPALTEEVAGRGPLPGPALQRLAVATVSALVAAHQAGTVHGAFGPDAVLLGPDGPLVTGIGIAPLLKTAAHPGDPGTDPGATLPVDLDALTPEGLAGRETGPPADVFAWARTVVFAATGHRPFEADSPAAVVTSVLHDEPGLSALEEPLRSLVAGCLAKDPAARPTAADALLALVGHSLLTVPLDRAPEPAPPRHPATPPPPAEQPEQAEPAVLPGASPGERLAAGSARGARNRWRLPVLALAGLAIALASAIGGHALALRQRAVSGPVTASPPPVEVVSAAADPPAPPVATTRLTVPGVRMTLLENPRDAVRLTAYRVGPDTYLRTENAFAKLETPDAEPLASPGGAWLALFLMKENSVEFRDPRDGARFTLTPAVPGGKLGRPVWSPDGTRLLLSVVIGKSTPTGFVVLDPAKRTSSYVDTQDESRQGVGTYAWLPDGSGVAVGHATKTGYGVRFLDLAGRQTRDLPWVGLSVGRHLFSPSGRLLLTYCPSGGTLCLWDAATGVRLHSIAIFFPGSAFLDWYDDAHLLVTDPSREEHQVVVMDTRGREQRALADIAAADDTDDLLFYYTPLSGTGS
ncbi:protein kinase family protein [Microbispora sp. H10836]|uniref:protein kinase family protein n=1 Tax=Microbispora sp. H10836 TaxID=2729106 RepID=UPI0014758AC9|nr:protein kinase family protein [Microbispora sp. H10836]